MTHDELLKKIKKSPFNPFNSKRTAMGLENIRKSLTLLVDFKAWENREFLTLDKILEIAVPPFQRDNDKWDKDMKIKFIQNIMLGFKTTIILFKIEKDEQLMILDGLQRITAIFDFLEGRIKPYGFSYDELDIALDMVTSNIEIKSYSFKEWKDAGETYLMMNENITHSPEDINKAKKWFSEEKGIIL